MAAGNADLVVPIVMPKIGNDTKEALIAKWHVSPSDAIVKGQVICEVETDKASIAVESECDGRVARILVDANGTAAVNAPIALLANSDADAEAWLAANSQ